MKHLTVVAMTMAGIVAASPLHAAPRKASPLTGLPLTPVFFNTDGHVSGTLARQNTPQFAYTFTNTTNKDIDRLDISHRSILVLDGKVYTDPVFYWFGGTRLRPGETWTSTINVREYLPGAGQSTPWKWNAANMAEGSHTVLLKIGGKQYGPVSFVWHSQDIP